MRHQLNILGVNLTNLAKKDVLSEIGQFLDDGDSHYIVTPNPEIILSATSHDEELFYILNNADLAIADGVGLKIASWLMGANLSRVSGADLVLDVLAEAMENKLKVLILSWRRGLSSQADFGGALSNKYPELAFKVVAIDREESDDLPANQAVMAEIIKFGPAIFFSTLGSPWQEKINYHLLFDREARKKSRLPSVKLAIAVGGAFDYLTGKIQRAPKLMRIAGLEWLWRLLNQPWRWKRIINAVMIFPYKFFLWRFIYPFYLRPNVVCLLYKRAGDSFKILLLERTDQPGHWQLPQGGTDGQDLRRAGARELSEEIGTANFTSIAGFDDLWQYEFGDRMSKFGVTAVKARGYKGQKQGLFVAEFTGHDEDIKINYWEHRDWQWVEMAELLTVVHPSRREATEVFLAKFKSIAHS